MAPLTRGQKKALAAAPPPPVIDPADRISKLPKDIQEHILSFLPAQEAVRTCVLARTWRHVWKSTRRLLITGRSVQEVSEFVDRLLRVRLDGLKGASLEASEIRFDPEYYYDDYEDDFVAYLDDEDTSSLNRWIHRILECRIQMLRIDISPHGNIDGNLQMSNMPHLVSRHLTRLELTGVWFVCRCLNLDDGCPALEHLEINECCLAGLRKMTSRSLKRLVITSCDSNEDQKRFWICVPRLVSLWLGYNSVRTPLLDRMPELVRAKVNIGSYLDNDIGDDDEEGSGDCAGQNTTKCVVLEGLAQAKDLVLIADHSKYILRRDLRWCPSFSKLKTLILNEYWCESTDCSALACMLEHAPVLEKLTVLFSCTFERKYDIVMEGRPDATEKSTMISQYLKIVELKCFEVHQRVLNVLKFLGTLHIWFQFRATEGSR